MALLNYDVLKKSGYDGYILEKAQVKVLQDDTTVRQEAQKAFAHVAELKKTSRALRDLVDRIEEGVEE